MDGFNIEKEIKSAGESLNKDTVKQMDRCLYELTTTGSPLLDQTVMKKFKRFCRESDDYVRLAFFLIMRQLNKKHSEIRLSAFQVADELFNRSHAFREILVTHLQAFLSLTTETETDRPLPPPKSAAKKLKTDALHTVQLWYDKYGQGYKKLSVGYNYLKNCKHVDFTDIRAQNQAERLRIENEEKRKQKIMADKLVKILKNISEVKPEIEDSVREAESCLQLLLPTPADFMLPLTEEAVGGGATEHTMDIAALTGDTVGGQATGQKPYIDKAALLPKGSSSNGKLPISNNGCSSSNLIQGASTSKSFNTTEICSCSEYEQDETLSSSGDGPGVDSLEIINELHENHQISKTDLSLERSTVSVDGSESNVKATNKAEEEQSCKDKHLDNGDAEDVDDDEDDEDMDANEDTLHVHGLPNPSFNLVLELPTPGPVSIQVTTDNRDVVCSLTDASKLITNNYLPKVTKWLEVLSKNGAKSGDIKAAIDLKLKLENIKMKCMELKLMDVEQEMREKTNVSDDDDDEFEDVPEKEGYEPKIPRHLREEYGLDTPPVKVKTEPGSTVGAAEFSHSSSASMSKHWSLKDRISTEHVSDPTSLASALANLRRKSSETEIKSSPPSSDIQKTSLQEPGTSQIPVVAFGTDLAYWENPDQIEAPTVVKLDSLHRFWTPKENESEKPSQHDIAAVKNRVFYFTGQFEPVKWKCRAVMPNGKLCERMDRVKCPFHGKIIPRDKTGKPDGESYPSSSGMDICKSETPEENAGELPPWQDPELQRDIELATGHDLGSARSQKLLDKKTKGKGKGKGKKQSKLTNIEALTNTPRKRLEDRIFNKRSMKRVCTTLDNADYKRVRDKFASQFNYSLK